MRSSTWFPYLRLLLAGLLVSGLLGMLLGYPALLIALYLSAYLVWTLYHTVQLLGWLQESRLEHPPEAYGLWGLLFDSINRREKQHLQARERLQAMIDRGRDSVNALSDALILTDAAGALEWWNQAAEQMLAFRYPGDRQVPIQSLVRTPEFTNYFHSRAYDENLRIPAPDNPSVTLQFQITQFGEGERLILVKDVSQLVHLELMRRDFVSNVSHELKTPLTVITGYLETMTEQLGGDRPEWVRALSQMSRQASRMDALITDLLLLSRIETEGRRYQKTGVRMDRLVRELVEDTRALIADRDISVDWTIKSEAELMGDEAQLRSAFSNLLTNAVRYSREPGKVQITWSEVAGEGHLTVTDKGIGIAHHHVPRLTERFYRVDHSRSTASGGTGLGLAIVKHVLMNHDARLEIFSTLGAGSTFICKFPRQRIHADLLRPQSLPDPR